MRMRVPRGQMVSNTMGAGANAANNLMNIGLQSANQIQTTSTNQIQATDQQTNHIPQTNFQQQQQTAQLQNVNTGTMFGNVMNQGNNSGQPVQVTVKNGQIVNQRGIMQKQQPQQGTTTPQQLQQQQQLLQQQLQQKQQQQSSQQNMQAANFIVNSNPSSLVMSSGAQMFTAQQKAQAQQKALLQQQQQLKANELQLMQQRMQTQQQNKAFNTMNMAGNVNTFTMPSQLVQNQQANQPQQMNNVTNNTQQQITQQQQQQQQQQKPKSVSVPSPLQQMHASPSPYNQPVPSPANPPSIGPSPSPLNPTDEILYLEKLKELNKYVEPLRKLIGRTPKDDDQQKEKAKLNGLYDILINTKRRVPLSVLTRCEAVLKKLLPLTPNSAGAMVVKTPETFTVDSIPTPARQPNTLQPMGEVVTNVITSANLMSETRQNILPGMYALNAPMISPPAPPVRTRMRPKPYDQQRKSQLPRALQMEIINLSNERFTISLDKSKPVDKEGLTLACKYNNYSLPEHVCNLSIQIHGDYPKIEPNFTFNYGLPENTEDIYQRILKKLVRLPHSLTFTAILTSWEQSLMEIYLS